MYSLTLLTTLFTITLACQSMDKANQLAQVSKTTYKTKKVSKTPTTTDATPLQVGTVVKDRKHNKLFLLLGKKRLCLPDGLYQQKGLKLTLATKALNIRQSKKGWCYDFDAKTLALQKPPKTTNQLILTTTQTKNTTQWSYKIRVPRGPAAMGVKTINVCIPQGFTPKPKTNYVTKGYAIGKHKSGCEQRVFTSIEVRQTK